MVEDLCFHHHLPINASLHDLYLEALASIWQLNAKPWMPEGEGSSNNNDGEASNVGRLPKPWRKLNPLKVVFRRFYALSLVPTAARDRVHALWIVIELIKGHLMSVLNAGEIPLAFS